MTFQSSVEILSFNHLKLVCLSIFCLLMPSCGSGWRNSSLTPSPSPLLTGFMSDDKEPTTLWIHRDLCNLHTGSSFSAHTIFSPSHVKLQQRRRVTLSARCTCSVRLMLWQTSSARKGKGKGADLWGQSVLLHCACTEWRLDLEQWTATDWKTISVGQLNCAIKLLKNLCQNATHTSKTCVQRSSFVCCNSSSFSTKTSKSRSKGFCNPRSVN